MNVELSDRIKQIGNRVQIDLVRSTKVVLMGTEYNVYPCVLLVEGVHHGEGTDPVYYSPDVIRNSANFWNNVPVTVGHPVVNGTHVMCNHDGTIRQTWQVGHVTNARYENGKLKADLWINITLVNEKAPGLLEYLANEGKLEVSTGLLAGEDGVAGVWNEEEFNSSVLDIIPDHLALLPGERGACSWDDGCGVRVNKTSKTHPLIINEMSMTNKLDKIRAYVDGMDVYNQGEETFDKINFLRAAYDGYFVYEQRRRDRTTTLYKQNYTINDNEELVINDAPIEVVENITYDEKQNVSKGGTKMKGKTNEKACCPEKVKALIANQKNAFTEDDREWLESMNESQLEKLISNSEPEVEETEETEIAPAPVVNKQEGNIVSSLTSYLESAPVEIRSLLNEGLRELDNKRASLIQKIMTNEGNKFSEKDLKSMDLSVLANIVQLIPEKVEAVPTTNFGFSFPGQIVTNNVEEVKPYIPTTLSDAIGPKAK